MKYKLVIEDDNPDTAIIILTNYFINTFKYFYDTTIV